MPDVDVSLEVLCVVTLQCKHKMQPAAPASPLGENSCEELYLPRDSEMSGTTD